ncbi:MAG: TerB family tellurite resistance protein [Thermodesulfobacteriota bacterium]|nr:TerB family tellurite resistance protein [Thermodesulfobacteriota bacterium]
MIDMVKRFFGKEQDRNASDQEVGSSHDINVATCALFLEMANIDGEFSDSERETIMSILKKDHGLSHEYISELINESKNELKQSIDLWKFTNLINQNYSTEEKVRIIEMVWKIVYIDGRLDKHEDYLVHKLARLLRLTHKQLIDAKIRIVHEDSK